LWARRKGVFYSQGLASNMAQNIVDSLAGVKVQEKDNRDSNADDGNWLAEVIFFRSFF